MKLCPTGWHVPADEEWTTLENYLADKNPITALDVNPGGLRGDLATFSGVGESSVFWTSVRFQLIKPFTGKLASINLRSSGVYILYCGEPLSDV
jgi:hypothetical protein